MEVYSKRYLKEQTPLKKPSNNQCHLRMRNEPLLSTTSCIRGSIYFSTKRCQGETLRLITCPLRVRQGQEVLSVRLFIHSRRSLFYLPTCSCLWVFTLPSALPRFFLCRSGADYYPLAFCAAACSVCK